jgi:hypothetical protein
LVPNYCDASIFNPVKEKKKLINLEMPTVPDSLDSVMKPTSLLSLDEKIDRLDEEYTEIEELLLKRIKDHKTPHKKVLSWIQILPMKLKAQFAALLQTKAKSLADATSVDELFFIISPYSNALHPYLLEHLVKKFCDGDLSKRMTQYTKALCTFRQQTSVEEFIDKWVCTLPEGFQSFELKLGDEWRRRTLEDLEKLRIELNRQKCCNGHMPYLKTVTTGCMAMVVALPVCCFPLHPTEDLQIWSRENQVLRIQIHTETQRTIIVAMEASEAITAHGNIIGGTIQDKSTIQEVSKGDEYTFGDKQSQKEAKAEATTEEPKKYQQPDSMTSAIIQEYRTLEDEFFNALNQEEAGISVDELAGHLKEFPEYRTIKTAKEMQEFITKRSSFYDYELLKYVIECTSSKGDDLKRKLGEYEKKFNAYAKQPISDCPIGYVPSIGCGTELRAALDRNPNDMTLEEVKRFKDEIFPIIGIPVYTCQLISVNLDRPIILTFMLYGQPKGSEEAAGDVSSLDLVKAISDCT